MTLFAKKMLLHSVCNADWILFLNGSACP